MKYVYKSNKYEGTGELILAEGYSFNPKITTPYIVDDITLYDYNLISFYIYNKFIRKYKKILGIVIAILQNEDSSDGDFEIALGELEKQKHIINTKYIKYLKKQEIAKYLKKVEYLELELKNKYMINKMFLEKNYGKGR